VSVGGFNYKISDAVRGMRIVLALLNDDDQSVYDALDEVHAEADLERLVMALATALANALIGKGEGRAEGLDRAQQVLAMMIDRLEAGAP